MQLCLTRMHYFLCGEVLSVSKIERKTKRTKIDSSHQICALDPGSQDPTLSDYMMQCDEEYEGNFQVRLTCFEEIGAQLGFLT